MGWEDWYWPVFLLIGFGVPEAIALKNSRPGDTLSEKVREWFGTNKNAKGPAIKLRRFGLLAAMAWLSVHWLTNGSFL